MDLLVLAAGMGSRYGGLKQVDPVGPSGETLLDYAVFDAIRAGFDRAVFVIRREFEAMFRAQVAAKYQGRIAVATVFQSTDDLPAAPPAAANARTKPWGTGHAVWCARSAIASPFAVINADDFYGADSIRQLAGFLRRPAPASKMRLSMVGFRLDRTLSEHGTVSRGIVLAENARLRSIEERTGIAPADIGPGRPYRGDEVVSMNCWGFRPELFPALERRLRAFLAARGSDPKAEFYLPAAIAELVGEGEAEVEVLPTVSEWFGITYREDRPRVVQAIASLVRSGVYPQALF